MKKVKDLMTNKILSIENTASLNQVLEFFRQKEVSHVIVTDTVGTYKGVISKTDLVNKLSTILKTTTSHTSSSQEMENTKATDIMTKRTVNLEPDHSIDFATELLLQGKFHSLPVIHNYKTVGLVTKHDLLKGYYENTAYSKNINHE